MVSSNTCSASPSLDEPPADEGPALQVEAGAGFLLAQALQFLRCIGVLAQVVVAQLEADVGRRNVLRGLAVQSHEGGAQRFVARTMRSSARCSAAAVQRAHEPQTHADVIRLAHAFHLRQEPQPLLGK